MGAEEEPEFVGVSDRSALGGGFEGVESGRGAFKRRRGVVEIGLEDPAPTFKEAGSGFGRAIVRSDHTDFVFPFGGLGRGEEVEKGWDVEGGSGTMEG